ncbi:retropepsin-like aspartic protease [Thermithiobacillus tepidarius DSM 3134]|uniref:retropepsin-like aspartic protease family protein n=1 Tax=Thermithiobacillus tepidarius TaxID=929 RepID=UPI00042368F2|nr:retropepsin-like aspartic protease [Thermithiobacillus tepidarius]
MKWAALLLLSALLAGCGDNLPARVEAPPTPAQGEVRFEWAGPGETVILVPVYINDQGPFQFVLDTGATLTCVTEEVAKQLALPEMVGRIGVGAGVGMVGRIRLVKIDSLRLGSARAADLPACALDLSQVQRMGVRVDGLLGLNFLRAFRVEIDFKREALILSAA